MGNGVLTQWEDEAHFSLWALTKAPLIIGCDLRDIAESTLKTLGNQEVIAISQDPLGVQGSKQLSDAVSGFEVWAVSLAARPIVHAVLLLLCALLCCVVVSDRTLVLVLLAYGGGLCVV